MPRVQVTFEPSVLRVAESLQRQHLCLDLDALIELAIRELDWNTNYKGVVRAALARPPGIDRSAKSKDNTGTGT